jgi:CheY-like chemotaxis protein
MAGYATTDYKNLNNRTDDSSCSKRPTILVAEDSPSARFMLKCFLEDRGYSIIEVDNGLDVVNKIIDKQPDLTLLDIGLPKLNGLTALRRVRKDKKLRDIKVIAMADHDSPKLRSSAFSAGCRAYVTKPISIKEIGLLIESLLISAKSRQEEAVVSVGKRVGATS